MRDHAERFGTLRVYTVRCTNRDMKTIVRPRRSVLFVPASNARALEAEGAALVILDKDLDGDVLQDKVERLLLHEEELAKMKTASKKAGRPKAAMEIAKQAIALIQNRGIRDSK